MLAADGYAKEGIGRVVTLTPKGQQYLRSHTRQTGVVPANDSRPYHSPLLDDADALATDLSDPDRVYANYLVTCRRLGVTPTPRDRAKALIRKRSQRAERSRHRRTSATISTSDVRG